MALYIVKAALKDISHIFTGLHFLVLVHFQRCHQSSSNKLDGFPPNGRRLKLEATCSW